MQNILSNLFYKDETNDILYDHLFFIRYNKLSSDSGYQDYLEDISLVKSEYVLQKRNEILNLKKDKSLLLVNSNSYNSDITDFIYFLFKKLDNTYENVLLIDSFKDENLLKKYSLNLNKIFFYENDISLLNYCCAYLNPSLIFFNSINWPIKQIFNIKKNLNCLFLSYINKNEFDKEIIPDFVFSDEIKGQYYPFELNVLNFLETEKLFNCIEKFNLIKKNSNLPKNFSVNGYRKYNKDLEKYSDEFLIEHYISHGKEENRIYELNLPKDFDPDIYKCLNPDLKKLTQGELEKHFLERGLKEDRFYKDNFFDKDFFIKENNILNYEGYETYLKDIRKIKSLKVKTIIENFCFLKKDIILVNHKASLNGAAHSLYTLARHLKDENKNFIILDTEINNELMSKYNISKEDIFSYEGDPTLLYLLINKIKFNKVLFNSVNFAMTKVCPYVNKNKIILFSRETKNTYSKHFDQAPDFVITNNISESYEGEKPLVQTPILLPFLQNKIDEEIKKEVFIEGLDTKRITLGMCGQLGPRKNVNLFLETAEKLPQYNFIWIGGQELKTDLKNVFHVKNELYPYAYYKLLDYFVLFSQEEPFGNVVIENLYIGNKVLTFKNNIFYDHKNVLIKDFYFEYEGSINLENAIKHITQIAIEKKVEKSKDLPRLYVKNNFSKYSNKFLTILYEKPLRGVSDILKSDILKINCKDGFANQLRLALAGSFLVNEGFIKSCILQWNINNHNNVNFLDYFEPLPGILFEQIEGSEKDDNVIESTTFKMIIESYSSYNWFEAYSNIINFLVLKKETQKEIDKFILEKNINKCLGIHFRKTCKEASLQGSKGRDRFKQIMSKEDILQISSSYDKIYLATDNKETQDWFKNKLEDKLIYYEKIKDGAEQFEGTYHRDKVKRHTSPLHTIADFIILSKCDVFIGSQESSFSLMIYNKRNNKNDLEIIGRL